MLFEGEKLLERESGWGSAIRTSIRPEKGRTTNPEGVSMKGFKHKKALEGYGVTCTNTDRGAGEITNGWKNSECKTGQRGKKLLT